jgi:hypothetical protein
VPCVRTKEPVAINSNGYLLHLLALFSYILHLIGQVMRELSPRSGFVTQWWLRRAPTHHPIEVLSDAI